MKSRIKRLSGQGKLILDATVVEQAIRYPTDLGLLNEAREISEQIIDLLYPLTNWNQKPRTYRQTARKGVPGDREATSPGCQEAAQGDQAATAICTPGLKAYQCLTGCLTGTIDTFAGTVAAQVLGYPATV